MGSRTAQVLRQVRAYTLNQLEDRFGNWFPNNLLPKAPDKSNSRDRIYTRGRTFWSMLWQGFNPKSSCREVVRQIQAVSELHGGPSISKANGAYCRAKARLPLDQFVQALSATAQRADLLAPPRTPLQARPVKVADGTSLTVADTPKNRKAYPPVQCPEPNFPMLRVVVLFSLLSGAILALTSGDLRSAELPMLYQMFGQLVPNDILMGDRGFGNFVLLALLRHLQPEVDFIGRSARRSDGRRRLRHLGKDDWLMVWKRGKNPSLWLPMPLWLALPKEITVRIVRGSCYVKGFRVRRITLVTTLLDASRYPAQEILQTYLRRWRLEMCLDDLKTTLKMDMLRSRTPQLLQKELYAHLLAHNLIRCVMAQAAAEHGVPWSGSASRARWTHCANLPRRSAKPRPKRSAQPSGPSCSKRWLPIKSLNGPNDANLAPSNASKTSTPVSTGHAISLKICLNATAVAHSRACVSRVLSKRHSPAVPISSIVRIAVSLPSGPRLQVRRRSGQAP